MDILGSSSHGASKKDADRLLKSFGLRALPEPALPHVACGGTGTPPPPPISEGSKPISYCASTRCLKSRREANPPKAKYRSGSRDKSLRMGICALALTRQTGQPALINICRDTIRAPLAKTQGLSIDGDAITFGIPIRVWTAHGLCTKRQRGINNLAEIHGNGPEKPGVLSHFSRKIVPA